jgi:hypothetical protein
MIILGTYKVFLDLMEGSGGVIGKGEHVHCS